MSLRRFYGLCGALVFLAGVVLCRTYWVGQQAAYAASAGGQTVQTLDLPRARGDFYDRNGRKLTGTQTQYYALWHPRRRWLHGAVSLCFLRKAGRTLRPP